MLLSRIFAYRRSLAAVYRARRKVQATFIHASGYVETLLFGAILPAVQRSISLKKFLLTIVSHAEIGHIYITYYSSNDMTGPFQSRFWLGTLSRLIVLVALS